MNNTKIAVEYRTIIFIIVSFLPLICETANAFVYIGHIHVYMITNN